MSAAPLIVGAGLAGLVAGHIFPAARIVEREPEPRQLHKALLRFRSDAVALITGVPFRRVRVHKAIWCDGAFRAPDPRMANMYSRKVLGLAVARSIWNVEPADRFVAPEDFYARLVANLGARITWGVDIADAPVPTSSDPPLISTMPMNAAVRLWLGDPQTEFHYAPIHVRRVRLPPGTDIHQTVYLPDAAESSTYRVSVTGATMIIESMNAADALDTERTLEILGLDDGEETYAETSREQRYGKIAPIEDQLRKEIIHRLSVQHNIYSLGRFATWRNILLDDVVGDARVIKAMIEAGDVYARRLQMMT